MSYNQITIDLEDLKSYIKSLPTEMEEWYDEGYMLHADGIHAYIKTIDLKFADKFNCFINNYYEERNKENMGE